MAMILDAFMSKCCTFLTDYVQEEVTMLLGVRDELKKLLQRMRSIQSLLKDAERRKFDESSIDLWLSELKDVMYDADDIIDLCRIEGTQLLADPNPKSKTSLVCSNFSSAFSCCTSVPFRHEIGNRIKELNDRLNRIFENKKQFKLGKSEAPETPKITLVNSRQTDSLVDPLVVGREVEDAANKLVDHLVEKKGEKNCHLFAIAGMGGIGKTTLAQKIFNHQMIKAKFNLKVWVCISQTYSEIELLQQIIREANGSYGNANTKSELQPRLTDYVASCQSLFLVLDDVWRSDVWVDLLRVPLYNANTTIRVLVTTRDENVANCMQAAYVHHVEHLSPESSWDMLRRRLFSEGQEELANGLKEIGFKIVERCGYLPLAIKAIGGVLASKERKRQVWEKVLGNDAWSMSKFPEDLRGALYLSFEDLPSNLKQCFLYFSLYAEDALLDRRDLTLLWVAEGFVTQQQDSLMEDLSKEYFNELLGRNLLLSTDIVSYYNIHDLIRSLAIFLSKEETSFKYGHLKNSTTFTTKLRRLSIVGERHGSSKEILDSILDQGVPLRTLFASYCDMKLNDERLTRLSHLRVLDISTTWINILPDSIGDLVHLRYLNLSFTNIVAIPESIERLAYIQFLKIRTCLSLTQLPGGIIRLHNLRHLDLYQTPLSFIPMGIGKLKQLNFLSGFVVANNDSSSKMEELNSLKEIRMLHLVILEIAQSGSKFLGELSYLSDLTLELSRATDISEKNAEKQLTIEKLFDELTPPKSLEKLTIENFFGRHFPNWMALSTFERCVPLLTILNLRNISSCTQLPPLGQLPELREVGIYSATKVKKIGPEFLGGGFNSTTRIAFPKLERLTILDMPILEEWSFGAQVELDASPRLELLPYLKELSIYDCPLLKQLPKGLKHSNMKSLLVREVDSLKSIEDLPPTIKELVIHSCESLSYLEDLDALQKLKLHCDGENKLPEWLLIFLQRRVLRNNTNEGFLLELNFLHCEVFQECLKGGCYWDIIQHIPNVRLEALDKSYLTYIKKPFFYDTNSN